MRITLLLMTVFWSTIAMAQDQTINAFVNQYDQEESVTHITLRGGLLNLFRDKDGNNNDRTKNSRLDALEIISFDDRSALRTGDVSRLYQGIRAEDYEELMRIRDDGNWVQMYLLEDRGGTITDLLLLIDGKENFCLVHLTGQMTYEDLHQIEISDDKGGNAFRQLPKERSGEQP